MNDKNAKEQIIDTTITMIQKRGYNNVTTNHIAKEAKVSIGTLYYHFPSGKVDIVRAMVERGISEVYDDERVKNLTISDIPKYLRAFLLRYIKQHRKNASLVAAIEMAILSSDESSKPNDDLYTAQLNVIPLVSRVLTQFEVSRKEDLEKMSKLIFHTLDSLIHRHVVYSNIVKTDEELVDYLINLSMAYLEYIKRM
jgi:AcrR family transcriptional regulator